MQTAPALCLICLAAQLAACDHDKAESDMADQNDVPAAADPHPLPLVQQPNVVAVVPVDPNHVAHDPNCLDPNHAAHDPNGPHGTVKSGVMHVTPHPHSTQGVHPHK